MSTITQPQTPVPAQQMPMMDPHHPLPWINTSTFEALEKAVEENWITVEHAKQFATALITRAIRSLEGSAGSPPSTAGQQDTQR